MSLRSTQVWVSIGRIARATGEGALRTWEAQYGFPRPRRTASGHRRYTEGDLAAIEQIRRDREAGLSLEAAIRRARSITPGRGVDQRPPSSLISRA